MSYFKIVLACKVTCVKQYPVCLKSKLGGQLLVSKINFKLTCHFGKVRSVRIFKFSFISVLQCTSQMLISRPCFFVQEEEKCWYPNTP